jgi:aminopeptidase N
MTATRNGRKVCGALTALGLLAGPALAIDPFFPTFGNGGIDVVHYNVDLDVDPVSGAIKARTGLTIRALKRLTSFSLDLHGLDVSRVAVNGRAASFGRVGDKLAITPGRPVPAGGVMLVDVAYGGVPEALADPTAPGDELFLGWFKYRTATYVVSEPVGASSFFPANDEPTDKASYLFNVTVPEGYTGVANGVLVGQKPVDGRRRFTWAMLEPMTSWLATVHVNKFQTDISHAPDGTPNRVYAPDGIPQSHIDGYAKSGKMLTYFESLIGPYPYGSYGSVVVEDPILYYALETQAMSTFPAGNSPPSEALVAHELAHQWFGNSVSVAKWEDLWFAEGLATYFEFVWEHRNDPAAFDAAMLDNYDYVVAEKLKAAVVEAPGQLFTDRTYLRGAAALYALRLQVGDSSFFNILRHIVQDNRGGSITSEGFIRTAVRFSGDGSVRPLLEAWLYDDAVPDLPGGSGRKAKPGPVTRPDIAGSRCGRHHDVRSSCE